MKISIENQADRRQSILAAAEKVFGDCGYAATTMEAVAIKAGISKGSIYNYFKNKHDLFKSLFTGAFQVMQNESLLILESSLPVSQRIEKVLDLWFIRLGQYKHMHRLMLEFWATAARQESASGLAGMFRQMYEFWRGKLSDILQSGVESGEFGPDLNPQVAASLIMAIIDGIEVQTSLDIGLVISPEFVSALKRAILSALRAGQAGPA
jgi:AcrR family transcriptional regulator